ncbi:MAG: 50S ribosomal protein L20 [Candidatus Omnitrophota bacterium]|jgi:large subunit ribosomal protein L20
MRVKHQPAARARKKKILKMAKGYWGRRSKHYRRAIETVRRALVYSYRDRRVRRREFRALWITRINAAARAQGLTYKELINILKNKNVLLSRDMLAKIAAEYPVVFDKIVEEVKK